MSKEETTGHIGASWWETSKGTWRCAASSLGGPSAASTIEGTESDAKREALKNLDDVKRQIQ